MIYRNILNPTGGGGGRLRLLVYTNQTFITLTSLNFRKIMGGPHQRHQRKQLLLHVSEGEGVIKGEGSVIGDTETLPIIFLNRLLLTFFTSTRH